MATDNFLKLHRDVAGAMLSARLTGSEYRALMLIIVEHLKHAGKENGNLIVTKANFIKGAGIDHDSVAGAIRSLEAKGFIEVKGGEYNPATGRKNCLSFTLAFMESKSGASTFRFSAGQENRTGPGRKTGLQAGRKNRTTGVQAGKPDYILEKDLPLPPDAGLPTDLPEAPPRRRPRPGSCPTLVRSGRNGRS
jgi:DNA-binding MarR family transcriptional regulator